MKKYIKYLIFILIVSGLWFLYHFALQRDYQKKIKGIQVAFFPQKNTFLTVKMIDKLLIQNHKSLTKQRKIAVNLHTLETRILANPYVEKATVFLTINGVLKTEIKQRIPIARVEMQPESYYIDKYGVKMPISKNYSDRVPLITGVKTNKDIKAITKLANKISKDDFLKKEIIGIRELENKTYIFVVRSGDYKILFGKLTNIDIKFSKLKAFYNKAFTDKTIRKYKTIDLKYQNQVVCAK